MGNKRKAVNANVGVEIETPIAVEVEAPVVKAEVEVPKEVKVPKVDVRKVCAPLLNVRKTPSFDGEIADIISCGTELVIAKEKNGWGKTEKGWVNLEFVK